MARSKKPAIRSELLSMVPGARRVVPRDTLMTAEEIFLLPDDGKQHELLDGVLIEMSPPGWEHGYVMGNVSFALNSFVRPNQLGLVLEGDPGVILRRGPDTVLGP